MCRCLQIARRTYYNTIKKFGKEDRCLPHEPEVISAFYESEENYGSYKLKEELAKQGIAIAKRTIRKIMVKYGLKSPYVKKKYKIYSDKSNESKVEDLVKQRFNGRKPLEVVVSDLTYVQVVTLETTSASCKIFLAGK